MAGRRGSEIITPVATLCYSHLTQVDDNGKYRAELVFGNDLNSQETALMEKLEKSSADLIEAEWGKKSKGKKTGIIRADQTATDDDLHNNCLGIIRPWSKPRNGENTVKFKHVNNIKTLLTADEVKRTFYDGCKVRAVVVGFTFSIDGNNGVSWFLNQLIFCGDGERIGGGASEADDALASLCGGSDEEDGAVDSLL